jgi:hypothetical protein
MSSNNKNKTINLKESFSKLSTKETKLPTIRQTTSFNTTSYKFKVDKEKSTTKEIKNDAKEAQSLKIIELEKKLSNYETILEQKNKEIINKDLKIKNEEEINDRLSKENQKLKDYIILYERKLRQIELESNLRKIMQETYSRAVQQAYENSVEEEIINQLYPNPDTMSYEELIELGERIGHVSRGLESNIIDKIPVVEFKKSKEYNDNCAICFEQYMNKEKLKKLNCNHLFHTNCITIWLGKEKKCPLCKEEITIL